MSSIGPSSSPQLPDRAAIRRIRSVSSQELLQVAAVEHRCVHVIVVRGEAETDGPVEPELVDLRPEELEYLLCAVGVVLPFRGRRQSEAAFEEPGLVHEKAPRSEGVRLVGL